VGRANSLCGERIRRMIYSSCRCAGSAVLRLCHGPGPFTGLCSTSLISTSSVYNSSLKWRIFHHILRVESPSCVSRNLGDKSAADFREVRSQAGEALRRTRERHRRGKIFVYKLTPLQQLDITSILPGSPRLTKQRLAQQLCIVRSDIADIPFPILHWMLWSTSKIAI
jgi:hypothetical protein